MKEVACMRAVERWGLLPSADEPAWLTGAPPQGTKVRIRSTGQTVERVGSEWAVCLQ